MLANAFQAPAGPRPLQSIKLFWVFLLCGGVMLVLTQMVRLVPATVMLLMIGVPVVLFALLQLSKHQFHLAQRSTKVEALVGGAGPLGGFPASGAAYGGLHALGTAKHDQMRIKG